MSSPLSKPLPILPRASISSANMSLTENSRPVPELHLLHPPLSCMSDALGPRNLHQSTMSISQMTLPPLHTRQPHGHSHNAYRTDPSPTSSSDHHSKYYPAASLSHILHQPHQSPTFSPINSAPFRLAAEPDREMSLEIRPPLPRSPPENKISQRQDVPQDFPHVSASSPRLPSSSYERVKPPPTSVRELPAQEVARHSPLSESPSRRQTSEPMQTPRLVQNSSLSPDSQYDMIIRQQPIAARACGFGERDRRAIDPPPILELKIRDPGATPAEISSRLRHPFSVVYCELWNADSDKEEAGIPEVGERRRQRKLMGTLVASPFVGRDESDVEGCFFPFPDLSVRTTGRYRLKFVLVILDPARMKPGDRLPFKAMVLSQVFEVFPAKTFPGMETSTALAKRLKEQGCLISVKKGHQRGEKVKANSKKDESEAEDSEDGDADRSGRRREKRQRT